MKTLFIYNKKAGKKFGPSVVNEIQSILPQSIQHEFVDIKEFNDAYAKESDSLIAIGGDGTVNYVASFACKYNKTFGIIPKGSGDGLARFLKIPKNISKAVDIINAGKTQSIDTGLLGEKFFINVAGTGFEAKVAHKFGELGIRGLFGYVRTVFSVFNTSAEKKAKIIIEGEEKTVEYFSLSVANGSQWGNNFEIASLADITDGLLDVAVMKKPKWYQIPKIISLLTSKNQTDSNLIQYYKGSRIIIENESEKWHIDGEPIFVPSPIEIRINKQNLEILSP